MDPPHVTESPYILGLYRHLLELGWDVKVVLPSSQKSCCGKAYHIKEVTRGSYFYPKEDGQGDTTSRPRPLKAGEIAEWILLDGTPATCANVALFHRQIDLVVSGPNLGRNTSAAFALSSGTIGAALSSSLSKIRSIALSYGTVFHPTQTTLFEPAHKLGGHIIHHLWNNWGEDAGGLRDGEVDLYNVNIPLVEGLLSEEGINICWTHMWRNSYGRLFKTLSVHDSPETRRVVNAVGPDALLLGNQSLSTSAVAEEPGELMFKFSPDMKDLITPFFSSVPVGSDGWAIHQGWVSVTPLRASFGEPIQHVQDMAERLWKMKL